MAAVFVIRDGKVLLVHNIKHGLRIEPPGGKVHEGESYEECAVREAKEELGIDISLERLFVEHDIQTPEGPFHLRLFLAHIVDGEPQDGLEPGKTGGFGWYDYADLERLCAEKSLVPDVVEAMPLLREKLENKK